jgi:hypothetical protein
MGNPVAFDASALERDTRGFISITTMRPLRGWTANWMLQPPVSTPTARAVAIAMSRIRWYSRSVSVIAGATVIESPVCTPIGSMFSIEQTITALSWRSRISSSSNSFQPRIDSSSSTSVTGLASRPAPAIRFRSRSSRAMPDPSPPRVNDGRTTSGYPSASAACLHSSSEWQMRLSGTSAPRPVTISLNRLRSSPALIASMSAPISSTP